MRIRKNANVSSLLMSSSHASGVEALFQPHVCQLNQSPWDVIPLSQDTFLDSPLPFNPKSEGEDNSFNGTASLNDSISALESFVAEKDEKKATIRKKINELVIDDNGYIKKEKLKKAAKKKKTNKKGGFLSRKTFCQKNDGKGWHCKNQSMEGHSICEYHFLNNAGNYDNAIAADNSASAAAKKKKKNGVMTRRGRGKRGSSSSRGSGNPYEFYYYSGFGPSWGKRRGGAGMVRGTDDRNRNFNLVAAVAGGESNVTSPTSTAPSSVISSPHREDFGFVFDYEFDDDDNLGQKENGGKKRMRKPVKARSLKSLM